MAGLQRCGPRRAFPSLLFARPGPLRGSPRPADPLCPAGRAGEWLLSRQRRQGSGAGALGTGGSESPPFLEVGRGFLQLAWKTGIYVFAKRVDRKELRGCGALYRLQSRGS